MTPFEIYEYFSINLIRFEESDVLIGYISVPLFFIVLYLDRRGIISYRGFMAILFVFISIMMSLFSFASISTRGIHNNASLTTIVSALFIYWTLTFHIIFLSYGYKISSISFFGHEVFKNWVKMIDYIYLLLSGLGLYRVLIAINSDLPHDYFNSFTITIVVFAISLRFTKTSIEIFSWDKPR